MAVPLYVYALRGVNAVPAGRAEPGMPTVYSAFTQFDIATLDTVPYCFQHKAKA